MKRLSFPRGDPFKTRGVWSPVRELSGARKAIISCPVCGGASYLDHEIAANGDVTPSVVHAPEDGCSFHEFVTLAGWADPAPSDAVRVDPDS